MKYFVSLLLGCALAAALYGVLFLCAIGHPTNMSARWIGNWYATKMSALEAAPPPRVVTLGGSSGLYGISAEQLAAETGVPCVNFATHAAMSLDYHLTKARSVLQAGDVAVMAFEYEYFHAGYPNPVFADYVLGCDPGYILTQPLAEQARWFFSAPSGFLFSGTSQRFGWTEAMRIRDHRNALNAHGDMADNSLAARLPVQLTRLKATKPLGALMDWRKMEESGDWGALASFARWCGEHDVVLLATFPPTILFPEYDNPATRELSGKLVAKLASFGIPVLGRPEDFMMPQDEFFDTVYHLNADGRRKHTARLAALLMPHLEKIRATPARHAGKH